MHRFSILGAVTVNKYPRKCDSPVYQKQNYEEQEEQLYRHEETINKLLQQ